MLRTLSMDRNQLQRPLFFSCLHQYSCLFFADLQSKDAYTMDAVENVKDVVSKPTTAGSVSDEILRDRLKVFIYLFSILLSSFLLSLLLLLLSALSCLEGRVTAMWIAISWFPLIFLWFSNICIGNFQSCTPLRRYLLGYLVWMADARFSGCVAILIITQKHIAALIRIPTLSKMITSY